MTVSRRHDNHVGREHRNLYDVPTTLPESFSLQRVLGQIAGLRCLDLACGSGRWARLMSFLGACEVLGLDSDKDALAMAELWSKVTPSGPNFPGLRYEHSIPRWQIENDDTHIELIDKEEQRLIDPYSFTNSDPQLFVPPRPNHGQFDVVVANNVTIACSKTALRKLFQRINAVLHDHGRLVAVLPHAPSYFEHDIQLPRKYGLSIHCKTKLYEGGQFIGWRASLTYNTNPKQLHNLNIYTHDIVEESARAAGFETIRWHEPKVSEHLKQEGGLGQGEFWKEWEEMPSFVVLECCKGESGMAGTEELVELAALADVSMRDEDDASDRAFDHNEEEL